MEGNIKGRRLTSGMSCIAGMHAFISTGLLFLFLYLNASGAGADSCPCCGMKYGDPMPGDEARVHQLRREHEASCCKKASTPDRRQSPVIDNEADINNRQEKIRLQREAERREADRLERERKKNEQREFELKKQDALNSMKGTNVPEPGLKGTNAGAGQGLKNVGDTDKDDLKLKELDRNKASSANSDKILQSKPEKVEKGWQKALGCAMEETYARAELLGPAGVQFSRDLRYEMTRVFNEAGKPVKNNADVNIVNLNLDRQVSIGKGSAERQFIVDVTVYSMPSGNVHIDVQSYFPRSTGKKNKQDNMQNIMTLNKEGEIVIAENSEEVDACLTR